MITKRNYLKIIFSTIILTALIGCNYPRVRMDVEITSHEDDQSVVLNEETRIISQMTTSHGIDSVILYINGELEHTDSPPEGQPFEYTADQPWTPNEEGNVIVSVVVTDIHGRVSDPTSISLSVVHSISETQATPTPDVTITPEGLELTQTAQAECINQATFIEHITIPINANLTAGSNFTKIWRVNNNGTCDWVGYQLIHISGDLLGASSPRALPIIEAGISANIVIEMSAPNTPGTFSSVWRIRTDDGTVFGPELLVTINVPQPPTDTPTPTATLTPTPTNTPVPAISVDQISEQISISANSNANTTVTCPAGSVVVSGGFAGQDGTRIWQSTKNGNGWRVSARNMTDSTKLLNVYANCLINSGGSTSLEEIQIDANPSDTSNLEVNCPTGSILTGGGWDIGHPEAIEIINSSASGNRWQIIINNTTANKPPVSVYAICLSGAPGTTSQVSETDEPIPPNGTANLITTCPTNTYVTGGGFSTSTGVTINNTSKSGNGWQNNARNNTGTQKLLNTYAICYSP